ncbi:MAG: site-2 protease family protein [Verrucomicrobiales bacterium]|nr:site-2 protease family protein [Verrucomicrobiales bacterium]
MLQFKLFGFPIQIQPFFWLLCVLLGMNYLQQGGTEGIGKFLLMTVILLGSILWHELGHALARKKFGAPHSQIILHGFGGLCTGPGQFSRGQSIGISAAGPGANLLVGAIVLVLINVIGISDPWTAFAVQWLLWINIAVALLNLLPIYPLDGGHILAALAGPSKLRTVLWVSLVASAILAILGLTQGLFFAGILFGLMAWGNWQQLQGQRSSFP